MAKTAIFQDMSFHMWNMSIEGRDINRLLSDFGINSFAAFGPMQAKQYVCCNSDGHYVGDAILTCEEEQQVYLVGKPNLLNWVRFHLETGKYDARVTAFDKPSLNLADRRLFRFQVQGPNAQAIIDEATEGNGPPICFFKMGRFRIGRHDVTALNHRMSGAPGYKMWGPADIGLEVTNTILNVGKKHVLRRLGGRNYPVTATESGWIGSALPAIYTGDATRAYREWLAAESYETNASIGGSFPTGDVDDCYLTPFDMGYGFMVKFDHEFCGRQALEGRAKSNARRSGSYGIPMTRRRSMRACMAMVNVSNTWKCRSLTTRPSRWMRFCSTDKGSVSHFIPFIRLNREPGFLSQSSMQTSPRSVGT